MRVGRRSLGWLFMCRKDCSDPESDFEQLYWCYECYTFKNAVLSYAFKFILRDLLFYFYLRVYKLSTAEQSLKGHLIAIWSHFQN